MECCREGPRAEECGWPVHLPTAKKQILFLEPPEKNAVPWTHFGHPICVAIRHRVIGRPFQQRWTVQTGIVPGVRLVGPIPAPPLASSRNGDHDTVPARRVVERFNEMGQHAISLQLMAAVISLSLHHH